MSKRRLDLAKETAKQTQAEKRLKEETEHLDTYEKIIAIGDEVLNRWRAHLVKTASPEKGEHCLAFFTPPTLSLYSISYRGFNVKLSDSAWSIEEYYSAEQNIGPNRVAYSDDPLALLPPDKQDLLRLEALGVSFGVFPSSTKHRDHDETFVDYPFRAGRGRRFVPKLSSTYEKTLALLQDEEALVEYGTDVAKYHREYMDVNCSDAKNHIAILKEKIAMLEKKFALSQTLQTAFD